MVRNCPRAWFLPASAKPRRTISPATAACGIAGKDTALNCRQPAKRCNYFGGRSLKSLGNSVVSLVMGDSTALLLTWKPLIWPTRITHYRFVRGPALKPAAECGYRAGRPNCSVRAVRVGKVHAYGAWRSWLLRSDWGSRGRRFKSCRPDFDNVRQPLPNSVKTLHPRGFCRFRSTCPLPLDDTECPSEPAEMQHICRRGLRVPV